MPKAINVIPGERYGRLTVVEEVDKVKGKRYFECSCDCGTVKDYRFVSLRSQTIKSCGCLRNEQNRIANLSHGMAGNHLYSSWHSMKQRCLNPNAKVYKHYGGRGITICSEWMEFESFMNWALSHGYSENLTIERIDVNGNYEPNNCTWATTKAQSRNRRNNVILEYNGKKMCMEDWAISLGISSASMRKRLKNWPLGRALTEPKNSNQ